MFRVKIENEDELIEAIAKIDLKIPYSWGEPEELNRFLDFLDEDRKLSRFLWKLEDELEALARKRIETWVKKQYKEYLKKTKPTAYNIEG